MIVHVLGYTAFSLHPAGGRPVGVVLDATGLDSDAMLGVAGLAGVETAFLFPLGDDDFVVRCFSPAAETSFGTHATLAAAVAHAEEHGVGTMTLHTWLGKVDVATTASTQGDLTAVLTGVPTRMLKQSDEDLAALLAALGLGADDLDPALPPWLAFAGSWHPVVAVRDRAVLDRPAADPARVRGLLTGQGLTSVVLVHRAGPSAFFCRSPLPAGRTGDDGAGGAAAMALGGYLRALSAIPQPGAITVFTADERGRPTQLLLRVPARVGSRVSIPGCAIRRSAIPFGRPAATRHPALAGQRS